MKYKELISKMILEEKASLLSGKDFWQSKPIKRLSVPVMSLADGPHGLRKQAGDADHLGLNVGVPATCFPTAATVANSWDPELGTKIGELLGKEAIAEEISVILGPGLNIKRSPLCGRNFEYFSEDPYLSGKMAAGYVHGIQSQGVSACLKHFAVNNQEYLRMTNDSVVDKRTLHEIYLTGFEIAVKEAEPKTIMSSYNRVNGTYANESQELLRDILVDRWGFEGMVVSDWGGSNDHVAGVEAGSHLEMPTAGVDTDYQIVDAVKKGLLSEEILEERVDEYLRVLYDVQKDYTYEKVKVDFEVHHDFARKVAEESAVLLKNQDDILPLKPGIKVAVIGDFAKTPRYQGAGSSLVNPTKVENTLDYIGETQLEMIGYKQGFNRTGGKDDEKIQKACQLAKKAEVVLLYLGLDEVSETEGLDRSHMGIHQNQVDLLNAINHVNPNIVVVLSCGSAIEMPWVSQCKAVVHGYLAGQAGATALINVVTGKCCPSGKLSETYPMTYQDTPIYNYYPGKEVTAEYREGLYVGYRYYDTAGVKVRFPFGFGLSYTTFEYSDFKLTESEATFKIMNTGKVAGAEIAQLYVGIEANKIFRPKKELKGFAKVFLEAGESKEVTIPLDDKAFRYFNVKTDSFQIESGKYKVMVGKSSEDIRLIDEIHIEGTDADIPYDNKVLKSYYSGSVKNVTDSEFESLLGRPIPQAKWDRIAPIGRNDTISQLFYAKSWVARLVYKIITYLKDKSYKKGKPDLNILFIYNMPFRAIAKMMNGMISMEMVDGLLVIVNGHFFRGLWEFIRGWFKLRKLNKLTKHSLNKTAISTREEQ